MGWRQGHQPTEQHENRWVLPFHQTLAPCHQGAAEITSAILLTKNGRRALHATWRDSSPPPHRRLELAQAM